MKLDYFHFNLVFFFINLIVKIYSAGIKDEKLVQTSKVFVCTAITKLRFSQDKVYKMIKRQKFIENLIHKINDEYSINEGENKVLSLALVNCYRRIDPQNALDVIYIFIVLLLFKLVESIQKGTELNSIQKKYKNLLGLEESWDNIDNESFINDLLDINKILNSLQDGVLKLNFNFQKENIEEVKPSKFSNKKQSHQFDNKNSQYKSQSFLDNLKQIIFSIFIYFIELFFVGDIFSITILILGTFFIIILKKYIYRKKASKQIPNVKNKKH